MNDNNKEIEEALDALEEEEYQKLLTEKPESLFCKIMDWLPVPITIIIIALLIWLFKLDK